jgi:hypothetical protein
VSADLDDLPDRLAAIARVVQQTEPAAEPDDPAGANRLRRRALEAVRARRTEFLLPGLIPLKVLTLVAGVGGLGKSTWLAGVAAQVSRGEPLGRDPSDVLLVSFEDTAAEVLRPRVEAAGGDLARVHELYVDPVDGAPLTLPTDLADLKRHIEDVAARLVVVDPIIAAIDLSLDAHKDQHVRVVLAELAAIAEQTNCAVALVGHLNKTPSRDAYIRVGSSVAFYNAARSVVLVTADPDEPEQHRLVTQAKANYARLTQVQRHVLEEIQLEQLDPSSGQPIVIARMRYLEDAADVDRNGVLDEPRRDAGDEKLAQALVFLVRSLDDGGWHDSAGLKVLAGATGISERTLKRAAVELGVEYERRGFPSTTWWRHASQAAGSPTVGGLTGQPLNHAGSERTQAQSGQSGRGDRGDGTTGREPPDVDALLARLRERMPLLGDPGYALAADRAFADGQITERELAELLDLDALVALGRPAVNDTAADERQEGARP